MDKMSKAMGVTSAIVAVSFFAFGVSLPLWTPKETYAAYERIGEFLGGPLAIAVAVAIACPLSGIAMYVMGQLLRDRLRALQTQFKLFVFAVLAIAAGHFAAIGLAWLGAYEESSRFFVLQAAIGATNLSAGMGGIAAMNRTR